MKALVIGGPKHGRFIDTLDGAQVWVDIENATTHRLRRITNTVVTTEPDGTQKVTEAHVLTVAVHQEILGPEEANIVNAALMTLALNAFTREHGEHQEIPQEPAGSTLVVPGRES